MKVAKLSISVIESCTHEVIFASFLIHTLDSYFSFYFGITRLRTSPQILSSSN